MLACLLLLPTLEQPPLYSVLSLHVQVSVVSNEVCMVIVLPLERL